MDGLPVRYTVACVRYPPSPNWLPPRRFIEQPPRRPRYTWIPYMLPGCCAFRDTIFSPASADQAR
jgi:hypothetical protein